MPGLHPLLEIDKRSVGVVNDAFVRLVFSDILLVGLLLQVVLEVLQQSHFLVQFFGVVVQSVAAHHVLSFQFVFHLLFLEVLEKQLFWVHYYFGGVVEEHP